MNSIQHQPQASETSQEGRSGKPHSWLWNLTWYVGPDLLALGIFAILLTVLALIYGVTFTFSQSSILFPLILMGLLLILGFLLRIRKIFSADGGHRRQFIFESLTLVRDWFPMALLTFVYENLHDLTDLIRPTVVDATLRSIDEAIFGIEPTLALQKIITPWLSEYMTFCYALYFVFPVLLLGILYSRKELIKFRELFLALSLCFYLGFLGYISVPAIGPRYFMTEEFTVPITGIWLTERAAAVWNAVESIKRDCFPSLHTAISSIALIYLWRYRKIWRGGKWLLSVSAPLIISLWFATVYLRYHWTIDVVAGWALAIFCAYAAPRFVRWYYRKKSGVDPEVSISFKKKAPG